MKSELQTGTLYLTNNYPIVISNNYHDDKELERLNRSIGAL